MALRFYRFFNSLPDSWKTLLRRAMQYLATRPALRSVAGIAAGLLLVFLIGWGISGHIVYQQAFWFLPAPFFLYVFLIVAGDQLPRLYRAASAPCAMIGIAGFLLALFVSGAMQTAALATGMAGAMCIFLDIHELRRLASARLSSAMTASVGALSGIGHYVFQLFGAKWIAMATVNTVCFFLHDTINHMQVFEKGSRFMYPPSPFMVRGKGNHFRIFRRFMRHGRQFPFAHDHMPFMPKQHQGPFEFMAVASDHFTLAVPAFENAGVGVFLFVLLLSLELLLSGRRVESWRLAAMVAGGILGIFMVNALLMTVYFFIGDMAMTERADIMAVALFRVLSFFVSQPLVGVAGYALVCFALIQYYFGTLSLFRFFHRHTA